MSIELPIKFSASLASDLPSFVKENSNEIDFEVEGIELKLGGGMRFASLDTNQVDFITFVIIPTVGILGGSIAIGDFIYKILKRFKKSKAKIGNEVFSSEINPEELRKIIREELRRRWSEDDER